MIKDFSFIPSFTHSVLNKTVKRRRASFAKLYFQNALLPHFNPLLIRLNDVRGILLRNCGVGGVHLALHI